MILVRENKIAFLINSRGVSLVEFSMIAPILLLFFLIFTDFIIRFSIMISMEYGLAYGIRDIRISGSTSNSLIKDELLKNPLVEILFDQPFDVNLSAENVFSINYTYTSIVPFLPSTPITIYNKVVYEP